MSLRATLDKGPRSKSNEIELSYSKVKSFKLVPRPLDKGLGSRQIKFVI
jgi:hypothetical protein